MNQVNRHFYLDLKPTNSSSGRDNSKTGVRTNCSTFKLTDLWFHIQNTLQYNSAELPSIWSSSKRLRTQCQRRILVRKPFNPEIWNFTNKWLHWRCEKKGEKLTRLILMGTKFNLFSLWISFYSIINHKAYKFLWNTETLQIF